MFIGHLPAGYVTSKLMLRFFPSANAAPKTYFSAGLVGAIAPDLDLLYFFLIDQRQHPHHSYVSHFPIFWISILIAASTWLMFTERSKPRLYASLAVIFCLNGLLHMCLDTIVGGIWWLAPFLNRAFSIVAVPALYKPWWLNFLLHWSFILEICMLLGAFFLWKHQSSHHREKNPNAMRVGIPTATHAE